MAENLPAGLVGMNARPFGRVDRRCTNDDIVADEKGESHFHIGAYFVMGYLIWNSRTWRGSGRSRLRAHRLVPILLSRICQILMCRLRQPLQALPDS